MTRAARPRGAGRVISALAVALFLCRGAQAEDAAAIQVALASHFRTAPEAVPPQVQLVQVFVNGVDSGLQQIIVASGTVSLPASTLAALRMAAAPGETMMLTGRADILSQFDEAKSVLNLTVPIAMLGPDHLNMVQGSHDLDLSPETWGAYANYDVNLRRGFGPAQNGTGTIGAGAGLRWGACST